MIVVRHAVLLGLFLTLPASAQFNRVFVSAATGNDAASCNSINTPCLTFQGAVNQVSAGGSVIVLTTGGYGAVTIGKALTIEAPESVVAFIHPASGDAITVNAGASDTVVLRGLSLSVGTGSGIAFKGGGVLQIERCVLHGFSTALSVVVPGLVLVRDTTIRASSVGVGVATGVTGAAQVVLERVRLKGNQYGVLSTSNSYVTVRASNVSGNVQAGLVVDSHLGGGTTAEMTVEDCLVAHNGVGVESLAYNSSLATIRVSDSTVMNNGTGLWQDGGSLLSRTNNSVVGNTTNTIGTITPYAPR